MYYTINPEIDALRRDDDRERMAEIADAKEAMRLKDLADEFIDACTGNVCDSFCTNTTVGDIMFESLEFNRGPSINEVLQVLINASKGIEQKEAAQALIKRMAAKYAEMSA